MKIELKARAAAFGWDRVRGPCGPLLSWCGCYLVESMGNEVSAVHCLLNGAGSVPLAGAQHAAASVRDGDRHRVRRSRLATVCPVHLDRQVSAHRHSGWQGHVIHVRLALAA